MNGDGGMAPFSATAACDDVTAPPQAVSDAYLASDEIIDWKETAITTKAAELSDGLTSRVRVIESCFYFVRDQISHSGDHRHEQVTCNASDVLKQRTGWCYAKSHLLAALLRANGVPTGLCYQRLSAGDAGPPYCLHGLNAVFLPSIGWYRLDARGNKPGIKAGFCPPVEQLAFSATGPEERDLPEVWATPLPIVTNFLREANCYASASQNLPDVPLLAATTLSTAAK